MAGYARALLPALPVIGGLPGIRHASQRVPDTTLVRAGVHVDRDRLATYARVCGFPLSNAVPVTYPHLVAFPLHLALMTDPAFPFAPLGVVHVANTINVNRPLGIGETLDLRVRAADLRPHPRGRLIDLVTTATSAGEVVWAETSTLLHRDARDDSVPDSLPLHGVEAPVGPARWRLRGDTGRRYAAVSGDRNPIHLYAATAKLFGFSRPIAHGMWTKARCLAALSPRLPDAFTVEVTFRKPIQLPACVGFGSAVVGYERHFGVRSLRDGSPHLAGAIRALDP